MERELVEIKKSVYIGMSIYNILKDCKMIMNNEFVSVEDKKYLSLYLGILYTDNTISNIIHKNDNINLNLKHLNMNEYIEIYKNDFIEILNNINYNSMNDYLKYLLSIDIINKYNEIYNIDMKGLIDKSNKILIKK